MRPDDSVCADWFEVQQGLRQGCVLSPLIFNIFLAAVLTAGFQNISEDTVSLAELVRLKEPPTSMEPEPAMDYVRREVKAARQIYKQVQCFTYLGGAVVEISGMSFQIARRTPACWLRIRRYLRELYDQPKVVLFLKALMVKTEEIEALRYGCSTWTLRQEHYYSTLRTVHHRVLLRIIGA